ncbi:unknown [Bacteroides sp. CAG:598]|nr:unknown [Bacteroides sp. CAG:598]
MGENIVFLKGFHEWVKGVQTFCAFFQIGFMLSREYKLLFYSG